MDRDPRTPRSLGAALTLSIASLGLGGCFSEALDAAHMEPVAARPQPGDGSPLRRTQPQEPVASFGLLGEPSREPESADRP